MSSLLDEAIVDAKALREAVLKNFEASLLEAYTPKIEEAVEKLLEQEAPPVGPMDMGESPFGDNTGMEPITGAAPGDAETGATFEAGSEEDLGEVDYGVETELDAGPSLDDDTQFEITRGELQEMLESINHNISQLEEESDVSESMDEEIELDEEALDLFEMEELEEGKAYFKKEEAEKQCGDMGYYQQGVKYYCHKELNEQDIPSGVDKITIESGDTLEKIAKQFGVPVAYIIGYQLSKNNPIGRDPNKIRVGQVIVMPSESLGTEEQQRKYIEDGRNYMDDKDDEDKEKKESLEITEDNIEEIVESLVVDIMPTKSGWAGTPESVMQHNEELAAAMMQSDKYKEERDELLKVGKELAESNEKFQSVNDKLKQAVEVLKEKLDEVNLSNAKLLYTNRILRKSSLNERQKETIVEALSNAGSVNEAKVIFETLQSTVGTTRKSAPQSLSEAVSRPSTTIPRRKVQNDSNPFSERMKILAGINKK